MKERFPFSLWRSRRIATQYAYVLGLVVAVLLLSFALTDWIARSAVRADALEYSNRAFAQTQERVQGYFRDLENVALSLTNNPTLTQYMKAPSVTQRHDMIRDIYRVFANARQLKGDIALVSLYDPGERLVGSSGTLFVDGSGSRTREAILYEGPILVENNQHIFFSMTLPVFDLGTGAHFEYLGTCFLVIDAGELSQYLTFPLATEDSYGCLRSAGGGIILQAGTPPRQEATGVDWITYSLACAPPGWTLEGVVPRASLFSGINSLQRINILTYAMVFCILLLMALLLYFGIGRPVRQVVDFMGRHGAQPDERLAVGVQSEIGMIAQGLNRMLDDIDLLSAQNLASQKQILESQLARRQTEMLAYRSQINPHFLYNTFECIRGMALAQGAEEIVGISEALSKLFRYSVKGDGYATLAEELAHVREYARIIEYRFGGRHRVVIQAEEALLHLPLPKMLIQPLVENAVFHGLENRLEGGEVRVEIVSAGAGRMRVLVRDNGEGMEEERLLSLRRAFAQYDDDARMPDGSLGVGLMNIYRRVRLFYGGQAIVLLDSRAGVGTAIEIELSTTDLCGRPSETEE